MDREVDQLSFSQLAFVYPWIVEVSLNVNVRLAVTSLFHPKQFGMPTVTYMHSLNSAFSYRM